MVCFVEDVGNSMVTGTDAGTYLVVYVQPGAKRSGVIGEHDGALKLRVASPPEKGKANEAVIETIAEYLGVRPRDIELVAGMTSRRKTLLIQPLTADQVMDRISSVK